MIRGALSTVFSILLIGGLLLSQCAACSASQPTAPGSHDCCQKQQAPVKDHCGKPVPAPATGSCATHDHGLTYEKTEWNQAKLVIVALPVDVGVVAADVIAQPAIRGGDVDPLYAPPPLFILNASFLI